MTNDIILVPTEETTVTIQPADLFVKREPKAIDLPELKKVDPTKDIPIGNWIMPPEQQGYIQAHDRDCL